MPQSVIGAILAACALVAAAAIAFLGNLIVSNRNTPLEKRKVTATEVRDAADIAHQLTEDIDNDRQALKGEVAGLKAEIVELRHEMRALTIEVKAHQDSRVLAERERDEIKANVIRIEDDYRIRLNKAESRADALAKELDETKIALNAALRGVDAYSIAEHERNRIAQRVPQTPRGTPDDPISTVAAPPHEE